VPGLRDLHGEIADLSDDLENSDLAVVHHVLFLCTGNSARSILAEAILNSRGGGRFRAYSAGSHPTGTINPCALDTLARMGLETDGLRSKSWAEFEGPAAPVFDCVITLCDAAAETCPVWPAQPVAVHWGLPDPAAIKDDAERAQAFRDTYAALGRRIDQLVKLQLDALSPAERQEQIGAISQA
jgi:protein-tyrosine-phosphatase